MNKDQIIGEISALIDKWEGKPEPIFMSKEYIDRRFDRMKYVKLRKQLNMLQPDKKDIVETTEEIFGTKAE